MSTNEFTPSSNRANKPAFIDRKSKYTQIAGGLGKLPPQALDLEEAVLGALMLEKDALSVVIDILKAETFYSDAHSKIFEAITNLFQKSSPVDILTVISALRKMGSLETLEAAYCLP